MVEYIAKQLTVEWILMRIALHVRIMIAALLGVLVPFYAVAQTKAAPVAVAANFTAPAKQIAAAFQLKTGDAVVLSFGSSGQFYSQITQGAPFEVFLSADAKHPKKLESDGLTVPGSLFTYALGKLVLWSATPDLVDAQGAVLQGDKFSHLSNANPELAPYGKAGIETLNALGLYTKLQPKIVTAKDITQAYQFVASGNAELGFVALSQVINKKGGSEWIVPGKYYSPIVQDAVLLKTGAHDPAAEAFLSFLKSPEALAIIKSYGYDTK
jgi:molybdate transport system substrate-binding protein